MKIWKISSNKGLVAYVKVMETCTIFDTAYAALQLVRNKLDSNANTYQLLDIKRRENMLDNIPVYELCK